MGYLQAVTVSWKQRFDNIHILDLFAQSIHRLPTRIVSHLISPDISSSKQSSQHVSYLHLLPPLWPHPPQPYAPLSLPCPLHIRSTPISLLSPQIPRQQNPFPLPSLRPRPQRTPPLPDPLQLLQGNRHHLRLVRPVPQRPNRRYHAVAHPRGDRSREV